jgi:uncharacterized membrane protein YkoI
MFRRPYVRRAAVLVAAVLCFVSADRRSAPAGSDDDHEKARRAYEAGEIRSLASVLAEVDESFEGQVIEVELETEDKAWIYEVELLTRSGNIIELVYDAATVQLIKTEGHGVEAARKKR